MKIFYLLALLPVAFAFTVDDGCGKYDRCDRLGVRGAADVCGDLCGYAKGGAFGKDVKREHDETCGDFLTKDKYAISDNEYRGDNYCLDADLCARGRFVGFGNDDRGRCYEQVARFRKGEGYNNCGKRKRYGDYDTCGKLKRYGDKNWHAKVGLRGKVRAGGKYDLTGKSTVESDFTDFGNFNNYGQVNDAHDTATGTGYAAKGGAELSGPVRAHADLGRLERYERHDEPEKTPDLCGRYCDRCERYDPYYRSGPCRCF
jgi:hypothetical protein